MSTSPYVFGRLQFTKDGKIASMFTIPIGEYTYLIIAEFVVNKWVPFWSAKTLTSEVDANVGAMVMAMHTNLVNFFTDQPASENVNDEIVETVRTL